MPFILMQFLDTLHLKWDFVNIIKENCLLTNLRQVKGEVIRIWSLFAKAYAKVFANEFYCENTNDYHDLDQLLIKLISKLYKVITVTRYLQLYY